MSAAVVYPHAKPGGHGVQNACPPVEYVPSSHRVMRDMSEVEGHWRPGGHGEQKPWPSSAVSPSRHGYAVSLSR